MKTPGFIISLCVLTALAFILAASGEACAQNAPEELEEIEKRLKDRAAEERRLRRAAKARAQEVAALRHRMIETANSIQDSERRITALEDNIEALSLEKDAAERALAVESENVGDVLAALQSLELSRPPALLVSPRNANQAARAAMVLSDAAPALEARAQRLREAIDRLTRLAADLAAERAAYEATARELAARRDVLRDLMSQKEKERDVAQSLASAAQKETARLALQATSLRDVLRRLERLAHSVTPRLKPAPPRVEPQLAVSRTPSPPTIKQADPAPYSGRKTFETAKGLLRAPVAGRLTGQFGATRPEGGAFEGMRFAARGNAIVTAPFEGRVVVARDWRSIGNLVILDVGGGYHVLLLGVGEILVQENQLVSAGEPVAQMAEGDGILDLEIRKNGEPVNPAFWLSGISMNEVAL